MPNVKVKESYLTYGGLGYFRTHAEEIEIGSIGEKRQPLSKPNYLEVKDRIFVQKKNVVKATIVDVDFSKTSKVDFDTKVSTIVEVVPLGGNVGGAFEKLRSGQLKLVKFSISNSDIIKAANKSPEQLSRLIYWGNKARIVHQIFVVIEASLANEFKKTSKINISAGIDGLAAELGVGWSSSNNTKVKISKGTCFAYLLGKIKWDARQKNKRTKIVDLNDDQAGLS